MGSRYLMLLVLGLTASLANILGGLIISAQAEVRRNFLNALVSLGAGFMLSATILEVMPRSIQLYEGAAAVILAGYLFVHLVEHTVAAHFHFGEETHREEMMDARTR